LFSRDPRRFFGLIYCRFVSLASDFNAFFTPGGSVSLAHREIRARSRVGGSLGSGDPVSQRSGSCNPRVRDRVLLASSLLSALASKAKWCQPTRWDGPFGWPGWPGWLLSQRVFIPFFSLLPPQASRLRASSGAAASSSFSAPLEVQVFFPNLSWIECDIASWAYGLMRAGCRPGLPDAARKALVSLSTDAHPWSA